MEHCSLLYEAWWCRQGTDWTQIGRIVWGNLAPWRIQLLFKLSAEFVVVSVTNNVWQNEKGLAEESWIKQKIFPLWWLFFWTTLERLSKARHAQKLKRFCAKNSLIIKFWTLKVTYWKPLLFKSMVVLTCMYLPMDSSMKSVVYSVSKEGDPIKEIKYPDLRVCFSATSFKTEHLHRAGGCT